MIGEALQILHFVFMGFLGALAYVMIKARNWDDLRKFKYMKRLVLGIIAGYVYYYMHTEWNYPNQIMSFVVGYMATDFFPSLGEKFKQLKNRSK